MQTLRTKLILLLILLVLVGVVLFVSKTGLLPRLEISPAQDTSLADTIRAGAAPIPAYSSSTEAKLAASKGFQTLVSYTDQGFEPGEVTITKGQTIRFTNNSSSDVWIAATGDTLYPRGATGCGSSALDSCAPFAPQDFWEFTFEKKGEWGIVNNLNKTKSGVVRVE